MNIARMSFLLLILALAACGDRGPAAAPAPKDPLSGRTFLSTEVTENGQPYQLVAETRISLEFTDDGRLLANAGCNHISGPVRTTGGQLNVDELAMTEMGCDPPRHAQDDWLAGVLSEGPAWQLDGPNLTISTANTKLVLQDRKVADPDRPLAGTWQLDTLIDGSTASSVPAGTSASLAFEKDKVAISGGCNGGSATYQVDGDTITFGKATMTLMACEPALMELESAVLAVIKGAVTYEINADRLTLTHPSGQGLQLHAP